jgi:exosome complex component RRP40
MAEILLPGDAIEPNSLLASQKHRLGPGIRKRAGDHEGYTSAVAGLLQIDQRKRNAAVSTPHARYVPRVGDLVVAQVNRSSQDFFHLHITSHSLPACLPQLAFEGATKKTRPMLKPNDLVYAKVLFAQKNMEVELSCVNPSTGKAQPDGLGPLTGGMLFEISTGFADRLMTKQGVVVLDELGAKLPGGFEVAVGRNGKIWVDCADAGVKGICAIGRCLQQTDENNLTEKEQKKLVSRVVAEMSSG